MTGRARCLGGHRAWSAALLVSCSALAAACASGTPADGAGEDVAPMHPDSLVALPSLPTTEASAAGPAAAPPIAAGGNGGGSTAAGGAPAAGGANATYRVEPGTQYSSLGAIAPLLQPGDVVEVVGGTTYTGGVKFEKNGTAEKKIVIRGVLKDNKRPVISGGQNTIEAAGDHYVFENLEITGGARRCFYHHAHDITLRQSLVRDCPQQGILGGDTNTGSLTVELCEVTRSGGGTYNHPIYVATDEKAHPGSVFRLVQSYIHDGSGGNNVKSRAERNEILYNWIEGAMYHELELIGPDGQDPALAREDSQVVGNVLFKTNGAHAVRIGGDGTGETGGRYRFVNNTIVMAGDVGAIRLFGSVESIELFNNAFYRMGGSAGVTLFRDDEVKWATGKPVISGQNNWFPEGSTTSTALKGTKLGGRSVFAGVGSKDLRPGRGSPLAAAGTASTASEGQFAFPNPLALPALEPPRGKAGPGETRGTKQRPAIGAFEP
jgi:hypothetical protein